MKQIKLTNSDKVVLVDDEDFEFLNQFDWFLHPLGYAQTNHHALRYIHNVIWWKHHKAFSRNQVIDHINHNKLDNQICNLREVSRRENYLNGDRVHPFLNIRITPSGSYNVRMKINNKTFHVGNFITLNLAQEARDEFLLKHGETVQDTETITKQD